MNEQIELSKRELVTQFDHLEARAAFLAHQRAEATKRIEECERESQRLQHHLALLDRGEDEA